MHFEGWVELSKYSSVFIIKVNQGQCGSVNSIENGSLERNPMPGSKKKTFPFTTCIVARNKWTNNETESKSASNMEQIF